MANFQGGYLPESGNNLLPSTNIGNASIGYNVGDFSFILSGNYQNRKRHDKDYFEWNRGEYISELKTIESDIRKISHDLSADFISESGFIDIIKTLIENQTSAYKLEFSFNHDSAIDWDQVSNKNKIHIYRMLQESMQNIYKHAKASLVKIGFEQKNNVILLSIQDDGVGFNTAKARKGIGLKNIDSRVKELKGKAEILSRKGEGTTIIITIPVEDK